MEGRTADARLERLLHVLPAACRSEGVALRELADALDTAEDTILEDLEEMTARVFYQPGGWPDDVQILIEADRVRVRHATGFSRPARLTWRETLCLALALRGTVASSHVGDEAARRGLLERAEQHLGRLDDAQTSEVQVAVPDHEPDSAEHRETLLRATRERTPCAILYVKPGEEDAEARVINPYAVVHAQGAWYVVAHCSVREGVRLFRVDRVLEAAPADATFDVPDDFSLDDWISDGRAYRADVDVDVRIRYSSRIARWIRERSALDDEAITEESDGSVVVLHRVADPRWAVEEVLRYGTEAELLEPAELRALVGEVAAGMD